MYVHNISIIRRLRRVKRSSERGGGVVETIEASRELRWWLWGLEKTVENWLGNPQAKCEK